MTQQDQNLMDQVETSFKEEIKKTLNIKNLVPLPKTLEPQPLKIGHLDRWRKSK